MQAGPPQQNADKTDNLTRVKILSSHLRETMTNTFKSAVHTIQHNNNIDSGSLKSGEMQTPRFDKSLEEFFAVCDQIEFYLKTAMECHQQGLSSQRYLPLTVLPNRTEPGPSPEINTLSYPQYLSTVRSQISYLKEIHDLLMEASQTIPAD